jgi:hypothetical protein
MVRRREKRFIEHLADEETMKAPSSVGGANGRWERTLARYLTVNKVPLTWAGQIKGFTGISGYGFRRIAPKAARFDPMASWCRMPEYMKEHRNIRNLIVFVTNRTYGDGIEDSLVVMRLSTFTEMFSTHINSDRERYIYAPDD